jgi:peptide chain release factor 2
LPRKDARREELKQESGRSDLWNDPAVAAKILRELETLEKEKAAFDRLRLALEDASELASLNDLGEEAETGLRTDVRSLEKEIGEWEFKTLLSEAHDHGDALLSIHAGAGGSDAQDWAEMLLRMYLRYAEGRGFRATVIDESRGTEAGIKSVTIEISGEYAYGYLKAEAGVHRLVRLSPFNANDLRQTSFALVEILPVLDDSEEIVIRSEDLRIDTYRASGAGGQHVNKTDSAVRITHLPTNIVASSQSERSQLQNRENAMKLLKSKLWERQTAERDAEKKELKGEHKSAEWGNQIRSYVLHPYTMVKDHRTKTETSNAQRVLDGDIENFIEDELRRRAVPKET